MNHPNSHVMQLPPPGTHLPALDGLRGAAILAVLAIHFTVMQPLRTVDAAVFAVARTGWIGVDLFFVLSGFLITGILYDSKDDAAPIRTFYARRFLRIFPLYYGFLLAVFGVGPLLAPGSRWLAEAGADQLWHWLYLTNLLAAAQGWEAVPNLGHFWSLAIEEQFYLLWPLAVLFLSRERLLRLSVAMLLVGLSARIALVNSDASPVAAYALTFTRWDGLVIGSMIALIGRGRDGLRSMLRWSTPVLWAGPVALGLMVWSQPYRSHYGAAMQVVGYPLLALVFGALLVRVLAAPEQSRLTRVLSHRNLRFWGLHSYGIYLLHVPIQGLLLSFGIGPRLLPPVGGSALAGQVVYWVIATSVTLAAAVTVWHLWERPFLSLKRYFPARPQGSEPAAGATAPLVQNAGPSSSIGPRGGAPAGHRAVPGRSNAGFSAHRSPSWAEK